MLYQAKVESYFAHVWYNEIKDFTYNSMFVPINLDDFENKQEALESSLKTANITFPAFIKLDTVSAKDTGHNGVFNSY